MDIKYLIDVHELKEEVLDKYKLTFDEFCDIMNFIKRLQVITINIDEEDESDEGEKGLL